MTEESLLALQVNAAQFADGFGCLELFIGFPINLCIRVCSLYEGGFKLEYFSKAFKVEGVQ